MRLGLRENLAQFTLLVVVNAFVGAMVGMERSILPRVAEQNFIWSLGPRSCRSSSCSASRRRSPTIAAGRLSDRIGRKHVLWWPVGSSRFPSRFSDVGADVELDSRGERVARHQPGAHLVDDGDHEDRSRRRERRGLAMGLNEFAGYGAMAGAASRPAGSPRTRGCDPSRSISAWRSSAIGLTLSVFLVRETDGHVDIRVDASNAGTTPMSARDVFWRTSAD